MKHFYYLIFLWVVVRNLVLFIYCNESESSLNISYLTFPVETTPEKQKRATLECQKSIAPFSIQESSYQESPNHNAPSLLNSENDKDGILQQKLLLKNFEPT